MAKKRRTNIGHNKMPREFYPPPPRPQHQTRCNVFTYKNATLSFDATLYLSVSADGPCIGFLSPAGFSGWHGHYHFDGLDSDGPSGGCGSLRPLPVLVLDFNYKGFEDLLYTTTVTQTDFGVPLYRGVDYHGREITLIHKANMTWHPREERWCGINLNER